ncbi:MAG: polysaccharide deacetylase family protein [Bacteroidetes bacterium]|nr:polysaccharide deacetylase family protein [Bacteroidota bacterium]MCL1968440.1 polysaccharide deacetylase family protein [Bacteroidota bacterium]
MKLINILQKITKQKILLPFYHTVAEEPLPHIKHLYRMKTVKEFQQDLDFLLQHLEPIDAETLYHFHINQIIPKKPVFHLTFDDGLKEMYEIVAPVLLQKGVPATFFINSGFVDNKALFYRYHASLAIESLKKENKLTNDLKTAILACSYEDKETLFQYFSAQKVINFLNEETPYLTTKQIKTLSNQGFTIGAHSIDHPYFYKVPLAEQLRQTRESLEFVSSIITQKLRLFAFPFTDYKVSKEFFEEIKSDVDVSFGTAGLKNDTIPFNIQRIDVEKNTVKPLKSVLKKKYLKYLGKFLYKHPLTS